MLKSLTREITLAIQSKTGLTAELLVWLAIVAIAAVSAFAFLCVTAYDGLVIAFGSVYAGLIMTGIFVLIAVLALLVSMVSRRRARERAILARAARAHSPSWLLDPRMLTTAMQLGRSFGWQRIVPVALLGFLAAQWAREYRERGHNATE